jgi:hypothetical protein
VTLLNPIPIEPVSVEFMDESFVIKKKFEATLSVVDKQQHFAEQRKRFLPLTEKSQRSHLWWRNQGEIMLKIRWAFCCKYFYGIHLVAL